MQFIVSVLLVISMLVIYRQIQHVKNRDVGYNQEGLITVEYTRELKTVLRQSKMNYCNRAW